MNKFFTRFLVVNVLLLFTHFYATAQCSGNLTLDSQDKVDAFDCEVFSGNLTISGVDIKNLNGLRELKEVTGNLIITGNIQLEEFNLPGLLVVKDRFSVSDNVRLSKFSAPQLISVGTVADRRDYRSSLVINGNSSLETISDLNNLVSVANFLAIQNNANLGSIVGLQSVESTGREIRITDNTSLKSITGFNGLKRVGVHLVITGNSELNDLTDFSSLTTVAANIAIGTSDKLENITFSSVSKVGGDIYINTSPVLTTISFPQLADVDGRLAITDNASLTDLRFPELITIGSVADRRDYRSSLVINNNSSLKTISGFEKLVSSANFLAIQSNANLESISGLRSFESTGREIRITDNTSLKSITGLGGLKRVGVHLVITGNSELNNLTDFPSLTTVAANIAIGTSDKLETITFSSVSKVGGDIYINTSPVLTTINFPQLADVDGRLAITDNASLTDLRFPELITIGSVADRRDYRSSLVINNNSSLKTISGFEKLVSSANFLAIQGNANLESISGLRSFESTGREIRITDNASLKSITGLGGLKRVGVHLVITGNSELNNLTDFPSLTTVAANIAIGTSDKLETITFSSVSKVGGDIFINTSPVLTTINFPQLADVDGRVAITDNASLINLRFPELITVGSVADRRDYRSSLVINSNGSLKSISSFNKLISAANFFAIENNPNLEAITGFEKFSSIGRELRVRNNPKLSNCCGLKNILSDGSIGVAILITGNPSACSNQEEILASPVCGNDPDCLELGLNIGASCDDGDENTENDRVNENCDCEGTVPPPCSDKGGDIDGDGICADEDCDDNDSSVGAKQAAGTSCDDGDAATINDMILADGCTCQGELPPPPPPCAGNGGDMDGDGVCADEDCDDNDASVGAKQAAGTSCDDGDAATINDMIMADGCTCQGELPPPPCTDKGGDVDGDGICADEDCDDNDASVGAKQAAGTSCDDGDAATINDMIMGDGCTCQGELPPPPPPCTDKGGDIDGDGVCADEDCDDNDASVGAKRAAGTSCDDGDATTINDVIMADGCTCQGELPPPPPPCSACNSSAYPNAIQWTNNNHLYEVISAGEDITWESARAIAQARGGNWELVTINSKEESDFIINLIKDKAEYFRSEPGNVVSGPWIGGQRNDSGFEWVTNEPFDFTNWGPNEPFGNGDKISYARYTNGFIGWNDIPSGHPLSPQSYILECNCGETPPPPPCSDNGGDMDGDGICADEDCDDNDPNIGAKRALGTSCDDGDVATINDVIMADGCTCRGEMPLPPPPCSDNGGDIDGDGICADEDCDDNDPNIGVKQVTGTSCDDGDNATINDVIMADECTCLGEMPPPSPCSDNGGDMDGDGICANEDCDDNDPDIGTKRAAGTSCDDGDNATINDVIMADGCTCRGEMPPPPPCSDNGGDMDGDGVCANEDCDDNDPNVGAKQSVGTSCDDGNASTINDMIMEDGCTCLGEMPPPPPPCSDNGGDADGDGICANEDCDDNDPNSLQKGAPCDDGNANTINDKIDENCNCKGTDPTDDFCPEFNANIGEACDDNDPTTEDEWLEEGCKCVGKVINGCNLTIRTAGNSIIVENVDDPRNKVYLWDRTFANLLDESCAYWTDCQGNQTFDNLLPGVYAVQYQSFSDDWTKIYCDSTVYIEIGGVPTTNACDAVDYQVIDGKLNISNLPTLNTIIDVFDYQYAAVFRCVGDCAAEQTIDLPEGRNSVRVKVYDAEWNFVCEREDFFMVTGTGVIEPSDRISLTSDTPNNNRIATSKVTVSPNPAAESVTVGLQDFVGQDIELIMMDMLGRVVFDQKINHLDRSIQMIDVQQFKAGVYQLSVKHQGRMTSTKLIIVR